MSDKTRKVVLVIGVIILLCGLGGLLYPIIGSYINDKQHDGIIEEYKGMAVEIDNSEKEALLQAAREYNERLFQRSKIISDLNAEQYAEYDSMLRLEGSDIMGYIEIPKIDVLLPIYHGTGDEVLQSGIGHLEGSSLPIGGPNTHAVLSGHSGLPASTLFTNLDQLEVGDKFTITVLDNVVTYEVDDTAVMLPEDVELTIEDAQDDCTLITCTPVGVNTHRLMVYAHRVEE